MYRVGIIDDEESVINDYMLKFRNYNRVNKLKEDEKFELIEIVLDKNHSRIIDDAIDKRVECLLIDNKIISKEGSNFTGAQLLKEFNKKVNDLPCIILTSWIDDARNSELVVSPLIFDKEIMMKEIVSEEFKNFMGKLEQAIKVFRKRISLNLSEYKSLKKRYDNDDLNAEEYQTMMNDYRILASYGYTESIPPELLDVKINNKLDSIINGIESLLEE
ncbi:hypothetical protein Q4457_00195 [Clostridium perfringens]|uniref:Uncharacterized protein n=1 Tax=Clostridium perfringens TaxID=1502 RepID=A0AAN5N9K3_CLOPF|nr:hypothetical protein [Clostridium perfringens]MDO6335462.1 hypothetical protein [Clostridium perfringens]HAT4297961.1 hypothetical protein [Clostridium perfringens]